MDKPPPLPDRPPVGDIYPVVPSAPVSPVGRSNSTSDWRLAEIGRIREQFRREAQSHGQTRRKYKRAMAVLTGVSTISGTLAAGCSAGSIITATTGIGSIAAIPVGAVALTLGLISAGSVGVLKWLTRKESKHSKIETLAENRENAVKTITSKALADQTISDEEFRLVALEEASFIDAVADIQTKDRKTSPSVDIEALKNEMLVQARKDYLREITELANRKP